MISFSTEENIRSLRKRLRMIHPSFEDLETEELFLYPEVEARLKKMNVDYSSAHRPERIPSEQI